MISFNYSFFTKSSRLFVFTMMSDNCTICKLESCKLTNSYVFNVLTKWTDLFHMFNNWETIMTFFESGSRRLKKSLTKLHLTYRKFILRFRITQYWTKRFSREPFNIKHSKKKKIQLLSNQIKNNRQCGARLLLQGRIMNSKTITVLWSW